MAAISRRTLLHLLASVGAVLVPAPGRAEPDPAIRDQGIGGTGARPESEPDSPLGEGDRGIGGTGVIGTIRRFGSIVVNDLRIAYPADVIVRIDGAPAKVSDLKLGQVVRVVAQGADGGLTTRRIDVASEVVGPIEAVVKRGLTVLGQRVSTAGLKGRWSVGERVAVSGLRRPDGVIVASLIEPRPHGALRVAGPVRRGRDGTSMIGGLRLDGAASLRVGQRATVTGEWDGGAFRVERASEAEALFAPGLRRVSIEAYVGRSGARLSLGSGIGVAGHPSAGVPSRGSIRAVLTTDVAPDGRLTLEHLRIDERPAPGSFERAPGGGEGPGGSGRYERMPERFGPGDGLPREGLPGSGPDRPGGALSPRNLDIDTRGMPGDRPGGFGGGPAPGGGFGGPGGGGPGRPSPGGGPGGFGGAGGGPGGFGGRR